MATYYGSQAPRRTIDQSKTNTSKHTADDNSMNVYGKNDSGMKDNADNQDLIFLQMRRTLRKFCTSHLII